MRSLNSRIRDWKPEDFLNSAKDRGAELKSSLSGSKVISLLPHSAVKCFIFLTSQKIHCQSHHFSPWLHFTLLPVHNFGWRTCLPKERARFLRSGNTLHLLYHQRYSARPWSQAPVKLVWFLWARATPLLHSNLHLHHSYLASGAGFAWGRFLIYF